MELETFDIVVVGAGSAGICVALEASAGGARVALLDKQPAVGGMLHVANGEFSGAGTNRQRECGIVDTPQAHFEDVVRLAHGQLDEALTWLSVRHQGETVDWLEGLGFQFDAGTPGLVHGHEVYTVPRTYWGPRLGRSVLEVLERQLRAQVAAGRVDLLLERRVQSLDVDDAGSVVGVSCRDAAGRPGHARGRAVVLATGGYDANIALRNRFLPEGCGDALVGCLDHATGDGLLLAEALGAAVSQRGFFLPIMGLIPDSRRPGFTVDYRTAFVQLPPAYRRPYEIWVNAAGERFVAEDEPSPQRREQALLRQPGLAQHIIFNQEVADAAPPLIANGAGDWTAERMRAELVERRYVRAAETLDGLAAQLGVDPVGLERSVARYNAAVRSGHDPDFGRRIMPMPVQGPPFFGLTSVAASILSRDGLRVDTGMRVVDRSGAPLPGIYAVGEVLGNNAFAGDNYVGGMSITPAMTLGRMLGARLAKSRETKSRETKSPKAKIPESRSTGE